MSGSEARIDAHGQRWPRSCRLTRAEEFRRVLRQGKSFAGGWFRLVFFPDPPGQPRFAISVRRSVGKACARNRARRQLKESLRVARSRWPRQGWGVIIIDRPAPLDVSGLERLARIGKLLDQTGKLVERHTS